MAEETDRLAEYRAKRDASVTPEPFGGSSTVPVQRFVIQKHAARRLHYDLRLEDGGVLLSWAVPQGISLDPTVKRFAAHTEDHPLDYRGFEGVIPAGEYGAGPMVVWDRGTVTFIDGEGHGLEHGKLLFDLNGYKVNGRFTLVKTTKGPRDWLLIKKPDEWASADDPEYDETSILTGRTVEAVGAGTSGADTVRTMLENRGDAVRTDAALKADPMLAEVADEPFSRDGWLFEIKYDGFRLIAHKTDELVQLKYRSGLDATETYPEIAATVAAMPFSSGVLDGEVVVLDGNGKPSFSALQKRSKLANSFDIDAAAIQRPVTFFTFDLLSFEGTNMTRMPLVARKQALRHLIPTTGPIRYSDHIAERGREMYDSAEALGLEGVMAKRSDSTYQSGRSPDWLKMRVEHTDPFAVVGFTEPDGARAGFGALHLAAFRDGALSYAGRVGTGFRDSDLQTLHDHLGRLDPLSVHIDLLPDDQTSTWVEPLLIAHIRYKEVTPGGALRHPVFVEREDSLGLGDVVDLGALVDDAPVEPQTPSTAESKTTNLDKVFWPEEGFTKGDLIRYYETVANAMLPYLADRPLVTVRYPDGIEGKSFYQKNAPDFVPTSVRTQFIRSSDEERGNNYFICDNVDSLRYIINLGAIPLHVWASRVSSIEEPDWCVLDLDPKTAPFSSVVTVAKRIKTLCDDMGIPSYPKTSGQSGLHVLVPMGRGHTYDQQKLLGELVARVVESDLPDIATTVRTPAARGDRVYIDFLQNGRGKLIAAPYAVRPVAGATVSTPLRWSEVTMKLDPSRHTITTVPRRLQRLREDPLSGVLAQPSDIAAGIRKLAAALS